MKKKWMTLIALALVALLAVSCSMDNKEPEVDSSALAYVTFGGPSSRDLSVTNSMEAYSNLFWYYTAEKIDDYGITGVTTGLTAVKDGKGLDNQVGPFSQGTWNFTLAAYKDVYDSEASTQQTPVYKGTVNDVVLKGGTQSVAISVNPSGSTGTIIFKDATFNWKDGGSAAPIIRVTLTGTKPEQGNAPVYVGYITPTASGNSFSLDGTLNVTISQATPAIPADFYTCVIEAFLPVDDDDYTNETAIASQSLILRVYGSATTVISGEITEAVFARIDFNVADLQIASFQGKSNSVTVNTAPVSRKTTTVNFENADALNDSTHVLNVTILNDEFADSNFTVAKGQKVVASIELTLNEVTTGTDGQTVSKPVTSLTSSNGYAVISTYIQTQLNKDEITITHVKSESENETITDFTYDTNSGLLTFKTTSFSSFYITVPSTVKNIASETFFSKVSLSNIADVEGYNDGTANLMGSGEYKLTSDIEVSHVIYIPEGAVVELDLNGYDIKSSFNGCVIYNKGTLTITDLHTNASEMGAVYNTSKTLAVDLPTVDRYRVYHHSVLNYGTLTIDGGIFGDSDANTENANEVSYGSAVNNYGKLTIHRGYFTALDNYGHWENNTANVHSYIIRNNSDSAEITINGGYYYGKTNGCFGINIGKATFNDAYVDVGGDNTYWTFVTEEGGGAEVTINGGTYNSSGKGVFGSFTSNASWNVNTSRAALEHAGYNVLGGTFFQDGSQESIKEYDTTSYGFASGAGTRFNPYIISTADQLLKLGSDEFQARLKKGDNDYLYIELGADITLTNHKGYIAEYISGTLDGNGHTITLCDGMPDLFSFFLEDTTLKNFTIEIGPTEATRLFTNGAAIVAENLRNEGDNPTYTYDKATLDLSIDNVDFKVPAGSENHLYVIGDWNYAFYLSNSGGKVDVLDSEGSVIGHSYGAFIYNENNKIIYTADISNCDVKGNFIGGFTNSGAAIFFGGQFFGTKINARKCTFDGTLKGYNVALFTANYTNDVYLEDITVADITGGNIVSYSGKGGPSFSNSKTSLDGVSSTYTSETAGNASISIDSTNGYLDLSQLATDDVALVEVKLSLPSVYHYYDEGYANRYGQTNSNSITVQYEVEDTKNWPKIYKSKVMSRYEWEKLYSNISIDWANADTCKEGFKYAFVDNSGQWYLVIDYAGRNSIYVDDVAKISSSNDYGLTQNYLGLAFASNGDLLKLAVRKNF